MTFESRIGFAAKEGAECHCAIRIRACLLYDLDRARRSRRVVRIIIIAHGIDKAEILSLTAGQGCAHRRDALYFLFSSI